MIPTTLIAGFMLGILWGWLNDRIERQARDMRAGAATLDAAHDRLYRAYAFADVKVTLKRLQEMA